MARDDLGLIIRNCEHFICRCNNAADIAATACVHKWEAHAQKEQVTHMDDV